MLSLGLRSSVGTARSSCATTSQHSFNRVEGCMLGGRGHFLSFESIVQLLRLLLLASLFLDVDDKSLVLVLQPVLINRHGCNYIELLPSPYLAA